MDESIRKSVRTLTTWLGQIIREREGDAFFQKVEQLRAICKDLRKAPEGSSSENEALEQSLSESLKGLSFREAHRLAQAFALYFQLVNVAEENHRVRRILSYERDPTHPEPMSLARLFQDLKERDVPSDVLAAALEQLRVEPVFTAHPTEAKRRTVLQHAIRIDALWDEICRDQLTWRERAAREESILETLEVLWQTKQVRDRKFTVDDEISNALFFFGLLLNALVDFHGSFSAALKSHYPDLKVPPRALTFGSWIGGDRDGNPFVTTELSFSALQRQRQLILRHYLSAVDKLIGFLSPGKPYVADDPDLVRSVRQDLHRLPRAAAAEPGEIYRAKLFCVERKLQQTVLGGRGRYKGPAEFIADLELIETVLSRQKSDRAARGEIAKLVLQAKVFRFHLARLDFRQHATPVRKAVKEILGRWPEPNEWPDLIQKKAGIPRGLSRETAGILTEFRGLARLQKEFGPECADHYVLSMTREEADIWAVLFLLRLAGLVNRKPDGRWQTSVDVVPLFETVPDLKNAARVMDGIWNEPFYRELLASRGQGQEVMLGYSDSNKNGGYIAANFQLYEVQMALARLARKAGIRIRFFHGKGGTIDRGGGPAHRAILAAPDSAPGYRLRITEQGEVIAYKYGHPVIARRNFEQMTSAVLSAGLFPPGSDLTEAERTGFEAALGEIASISMQHYRSLVYETSSFRDYFYQSTPIDLLEQIQIGSRPAFRGGARSIEDLRAIPWVFAWTQSRFLLSAWFGVGTGLSEYAARHKETGRQMIGDMYRRWPFFASLIDNAQASLAKTDMNMAHRYSMLVRDEKVRADIWNRIDEEHRLSVEEVLRVCGQSSLLEKSPVLSESIRLRNPYVDSLNAIQLEYLRRWRAPSLSRAKRKEALVVLLLTVNGVAAGLKSTG